MKKQKIVLLMLALGVAHVSVSVDMHMPETTGDLTTGEDPEKTTESSDPDKYTGPHTTTSFSTQETPRSTAKPTTGTAELTSHTATTDDVPSRSGTAPQKSEPIVKQPDTPDNTTKETIQPTNPEKAPTGSFDYVQEELQRLQSKDDYTLAPCSAGDECVYKFTDAGGVVVKISNADLKLLKSGIKNFDQRALLRVDAVNFIKVCDALIENPSLLHSAGVNTVNEAQLVATVKDIVGITLQKIEPTDENALETLDNIKNALSDSTLSNKKELMQKVQIKIDAFTKTTDQNMPSKKPSIFTRIKNFLTGLFGKNPSQPEQKLEQKLEQEAAQNDSQKEIETTIEDAAISQPVRKTLFQKITRIFSSEKKPSKSEQLKNTIPYYFMIKEGDSLKKYLKIWSNSNDHIKNITPEQVLPDVIKKMGERPLGNKLEQFLSSESTWLEYFEDNYSINPDGSIHTLTEQEKTIMQNLKKRLLVRIDNFEQAQENGDLNEDMYTIFAQHRKILYQLADRIADAYQDMSLEQQEKAQGRAITIASILTKIDRARPVALEKKFEKVGIYK